MASTHFERTLHTFCFFWATHKKTDSNCRANETLKLSAPPRWEQVGWNSPPTAFSKETNNNKRLVSPAVSLYVCAACVCVWQSVAQSVPVHPCRSLRLAGWLLCQSDSDALRGCLAARALLKCFRVAVLTKPSPIEVFSLHVVDKQNYELRLWPPAAQIHL